MSFQQHTVRVIFVLDLFIGFEMKNVALSLTKKMVDFKNLSSEEREKLIQEDWEKVSGELKQMFDDFFRQNRKIGDLLKRNEDGTWNLDFLKISLKPAGLITDELAEQMTKKTAEYLKNQLAKGQISEETIKELMKLLEEFGITSELSTNQLRACLTKLSTGEMKEFVSLIEWIGKQDKLASMLSDDALKSLLET